MLRAMVACTASTSSCKCGGLKKHPRKMTAAKTITSACSRFEARDSTVFGRGDETKVVAGIFKKWWPGTELNRRHADFQSAALPTELPGREGWASIECVRHCNYNNLHFESPNALREEPEAPQNRARLWVQLWSEMEYFRTIWRSGICVLAVCAAQAFSQAPSTSSSATPATQPAPVAGAAE